MMLNAALFILSVFYLSSVDAKATKVELHHTKKLLTDLIEGENHCSVASDCVILPIGARPCGGPSDYTVYSRSNKYAEEIKDLAELTSKLERDYHKENLAGPRCPTIVEPVAMCISNACKQDKRSTMMYAIMYPIGRS